MSLRMNADTFAMLKRQHGRLIAFSDSEGSAEWHPFKREFGYPEKFHALKFNDGWIWDKENGLRAQ